MYASVETPLSRLFWPPSTICYAVLMFLAVRSEAQSQGILFGPMRTGDGPYVCHTTIIVISMAVSSGGSGPGTHVRPYMYRNQPPYETAINDKTAVHQNWVTAKNGKTADTKLVLLIAWLLQGLSKDYRAH